MGETPAGFAFTGPVQCGAVHVAQPKTPPLVGGVLLLVLLTGIERAAVDGRAA